MKLVHNVYSQLTYLHKYNGKTLLAGDSSIITLSNHTTTKENMELSLNQMQKT